MISLRPSLFLFFIEVLVLLLALLIFVLYRQHKNRGQQRKLPAFIRVDAILRMAAEQITEHRQKLSKLTKVSRGDPESRKTKSIHSMHIRYMDKLAGSLAGAGDMVDPYSSLLDSFTHAVHSGLAGMEDLLSGQEASDADKKLAEQFSTFLTMQRRRLAEFYIAEKAIDQYQGRIKDLQKNNRKLRRRLKDAAAAEGGLPPEELQMIINSFESTNQELEETIDALQKQNIKLFRKIRSYEKALDQEVSQALSGVGDFVPPPPAADTAAASPFLAGAPEDLPAALGKITLLEDQLIEKDQEVLTLKQQLKDVETKYMQLYTQVKDS